MSLNQYQRATSFIGSQLTSTKLQFILFLFTFLAAACLKICSEINYTYLFLNK